MWRVEPHRQGTLTAVRMLRRLTEPSAEEVLDWIEMRSLGVNSSAAPSAGSAMQSPEGDALSV
ncbi:MAG TPA: hypothetical protein VK993_10605 [Chthoniobacterales bacterium]|nr:hypothetical protein [Chthoniobacterales bacterium]